MLKIEPGKFYRTRRGLRVEIKNSRGPDDYPFNGIMAYSNGQMEPTLYWAEDGHYGELGEHPHDLISEWQDEEPTGPVRTVTVTKKEIAYGKYSRVNVRPPSYEGNVSLELFGTQFSARELRDAAKVLNEIAEALEENARV